MNINWPREMKKIGVILIMGKLGTATYFFRRKERDRKRLDPPSSISGYGGQASPAKLL